MSKTIRAELTTLCYLEKNDCYLMMHRTKKEHDINEGKWIGFGGHLEQNETPDECLLREAKEETGLTLTSWKLRGVITFIYDDHDAEYMFLYTADNFTGELQDCNEGVLRWVPKSELFGLNLWEGDRIFLKLLMEDYPCFSLSLVYNKHDELIKAVLDGKAL